MLRKSAITVKNSWNSTGTITFMLMILVQQPMSKAKSKERQSRKQIDNCITPLVGKQFRLLFIRPANDWIVIRCIGLHSNQLIRMSFRLIVRLSRFSMLSSFCNRRETMRTEETRTLIAVDDACRSGCYLACSHIANSKSDVIVVSI